LGELTASLAHEVRNPLGSIKGVAEILADEYDQNGKNREFVDILKEEVSRLDEVVANYLSFARTHRLEKGAVNLIEILNSTLALVRVKMTRAGIRPETQWPQEAVTIEADEHLLRQAFLNLILNAIAAMPNGGELRLQVQAKEEATEIRLKDSGAGIPEKEIKQIFRPFYTTHPSGTGLGLPISKRIIEGHGGSLLLKSQPGEGTTVVISLPKKIKNGTTGKNNDSNFTH
jgi:two-component system sensor histidine kinase HydH